MANNFQAALIGCARSLKSLDPATSRTVVDVELQALNGWFCANELFTQSRSAAGSRSIMLMMKGDGLKIGRFKVRMLMREINLISKQPGSHAYKEATVKRPDIPNMMNREFAVASPNQGWCADITYIWTEGRWRYLAAVIDLSARRVVGRAFSANPDPDLVIKALNMAYEQRRQPQNGLFHSDQGTQ